MKGKIINIGVVIPLSGNIGYFGQQAKEGIELAYLISNKNNPKIKVKLIFKDDMADTAVSRELCEELITKENLFNNKISVNI